MHSATNLVLGPTPTPQISHHGWLRKPSYPCPPPQVGSSLCRRQCLRNSSTSKGIFCPSGRTTVCAARSMVSSAPWEHTPASSEVLILGHAIRRNPQRTEMVGSHPAFPHHPPSHSFPPYLFYTHLSGVVKFQTGHVLNNNRSFASDIPKTNKKMCKERVALLQMGWLRHALGVACVCRTSENTAIGPSW